MPRHGRIGNSGSRRERHNGPPPASRGCAETLELGTQRQLSPAADIQRCTRWSAVGPIRTMHGSEPGFSANYNQRRSRFPCNRPRDRLPRSVREITDTAADDHRPRERGGVAGGVRSSSRARRSLLHWLSGPRRAGRLGLNYLPARERLRNEHPPLFHHTVAPKR